MKIITHKQIDFYDGMMCQTGMCSTDFIYDRLQYYIDIKLPVEIRSRGWNKTTVIETTDPGFKHSLTLVVVGFCGKYYPMLQSQKVDNVGRISVIKYETGTKAVLLAMESDKHLKKLLLSVQNKWLNLFYKYKSSTLKSTKQKVAEHVWNSVLKITKEVSIELDKQNIFVKHNTPVFSLFPNQFYNENCVINPNLKELEFFKIMEGHSIYQNIEQFLGNELLPKDNPDQIQDDLILAGNHGYDKWSFRQKGPKKAKRKQKKINKC